MGGQQSSLAHEQITDNNRKLVFFLRDDIYHLRFGEGISELWSVVSSGFNALVDDYEVVLRFMTQPDVILSILLCVFLIFMKINMPQKT